MYADADMHAQFNFSQMRLYAIYIIHTIPASIDGKILFPIHRSVEAYSHLNLENNFDKKATPKFHRIRIFI